MAEVLEPRCVLSSVMTTMPVDDSTENFDPTNPEDSASGDGSEADCPAGEETYSSGDGEPIEVLFCSLGAAESEPTAPSPYFSEAELHDYLLNLAQQQWGGLFGQTIPQYEYYNWWRGIEVVAFNDAIAMDAPPPLALATVSNRMTSETNTQVSGVDEADFVETDGRFIYVARGGGLTIVDTVDQLSVASELALSGNVVGEFLSGDRLTVITQSGYGDGWYGGIAALVRVAEFAGSFAPERWNPQTTVTVLDVSDRTAPNVVQQTTLDGNFRDARAVNGTVYVVLEDSFHLPEPLYTDTLVIPDETEVFITDPVEEVVSVIEAVSEENSGDLPDVISLIVDMPARWGWCNPTIITNRTYESFDDYVARVGDQLTSLSLPHAFRVGADGSTTDLGPLTSAECIVRPQSDNQQSLLTVVSIDAASTSTDSAVASSTGLVTSYGSTVYMTRDALYVATVEYHYDQFSSSSNTRIDRFSVAGTNVTWQATGVVSGTLINQFAMDEHNGNLRVATHTWALQWMANDPMAENIDLSAGTWTTQNDNGVYVLDTDGNTLDEVGSVTGLAPGEQLYAARFLGDTAYLVTFLQTDPLFAIDLSDPANPTVQGELVIPGFSNYLQSVGEGLLLGIGQEREAGTWNSRLHVSLFDVSDGTNLTLIARQFLDESAQWSSSAAQYDHHALLYSAEDGLLVLPVDGIGYDQESDTYHFEQLLAVLHLDANGIEVLGEIHSSQAVFRTLRIDNVLYAVSESGVTAYSLDDFSAIGQADLFHALPWFYSIAYATGGGEVVQRDGGDPVPVSSATGNSSDTAVAIAPSAIFLATSSGPFGSDGFGGSKSLLAVAAQVAQNTANNLGRVSSFNVASNTTFFSLDQGSLRSDYASSDSDDASRGNEERSEASSDSSNDQKTPSVDAFWKEFTKRLREGNDPMPMEDADSSKSETPMNADKANSKTETPNTRSATEKQTKDRASDMSQRVRPAQNRSTPIIPVKEVTKSTALKTPVPMKPAR
jgi:uncharacterized secreted protein with C-terminal beta-propeller domain